jgi:hypothetical protein
MAAGGLLFKTVAAHPIAPWVAFGKDNHFSAVRSDQISLEAQLVAGFEVTYEIVSWNRGVV